MFWFPEMDKFDQNRTGVQVGNRGTKGYYNIYTRDCIGEGDCLPRWHISVWGICQRRWHFGSWTLWSVGRVSWLIKFQCVLWQETNTLFCWSFMRLHATLHDGNMSDGWCHYPWHGIIIWGVRCCRARENSVLWTSCFESLEEQVC